MCEKYIPKVGEVCEFSSSGNSHRTEVEVRYLGTSQCILKADHWAGENAFYLPNMTFHKIQSEEEKFVERYLEFISKINKPIEGNSHFGRMLYEAGFRYMGEGK